MNKSYHLLEIALASIIAGIALSKMQWAALPSIAAMAGLWLACEEGTAKSKPKLSRPSAGIVVAIIILGSTLGFHRSDMPSNTKRLPEAIDDLSGSAPLIGRESKYEKITIVEVSQQPKPTFEGWKAKGWAKDERALIFGSRESEPPFYGDKLAARCTKRFARPWICKPLPGLIVHREPRGLHARITALRFKIIKIFEKSSYKRGARSAAAMTSGAKSLISPVDQDKLARLGLLHLWAISGLHILILAGASSWLLRNIWVKVFPHRPRPAPLVVGALGAVFFVGLYTLLVGASPSALRATVAFVIFATLNLGRLKPVGRHVFILTCALELVQPTTQLIQVGSLLSHAAVAGILFTFSGKRDERNPRSSTTARFIGATCSAGLAATVATAPITGTAFNAIAPIGIILGVLWVPLISIIILPLCLLIGGLSLFGIPTFLLLALAELPAFAMEISWMILDFVDHPETRLSIPPSCALLLGPCAIFFFGAYPNSKITRSRRKSFQRGLLCLLATGLLISEYPRVYAAKGASVIALDVGHGDAYVLRLESGNTILIDAGPGRPDGTRTPAIAQRLRAIGVRHLDLLIITHRHSDHFGGLARLMADMPIRRCIRPATRATIPTPDWQHLKKAMARRALICEEMVTGDTVHGSDYQLSVLFPTQEHRQTYSGGENGNSLIARLTTRHGYLWITGDSPKINEERAVGMNPTIFYGGIMLVPHHGSHTSSSKEFIKSISPDAAMVSHGKKIPKNTHEKYSSHKIPVCGTYPHGRLLLRLYRGFTMAPMGCKWELTPPNPTQASKPPIPL